MLSFLLGFLVTFVSLMVINFLFTLYARHKDYKGFWSAFRPEDRPRS